MLGSFTNLIILLVRYFNSRVAICSLSNALDGIDYEFGWISVPVPTDAATALSAYTNRIDKVFAQTGDNAFVRVADFANATYSSIANYNVFWVYIEPLPQNS